LQKKKTVYLRKDTAKYVKGERSMEINFRNVTIVTFVKRVGLFKKL